jgi:hypothetical protein
MTKKPATLPSWQVVGFKIVFKDWISLNSPTSISIIGFCNFWSKTSRYHQICTKKQVDLMFGI